MMGLSGRGVKPDDPVPERLAIRSSGLLAEAARRRILRDAPGGVKRRPDAALEHDQIGLLSTSRMKAAPASHDSSASSAPAGTPSGPTSTA